MIVEKIEIIGKTKAEMKIEVKLQLKFDDKLYRSINHSFPHNEVFDYKSLEQK